MSEVIHGEALSSLVCGYEHCLVKLSRDLTPILGSLHRWRMVSGIICNILFEAIPHMHCYGGFPCNPSAVSALVGRFQDSAQAEYRRNFEFG